MWLTGVQRSFSKASFDLMWVPPDLKDHFWNVDHNPLLSPSKRLGTISRCWHNKKNTPADAHLLPLTDSVATLRHKLQCVLCSGSHLKDTCECVQMHTLGNCLLTQMHTHTHTPQQGTAKSMKLSKPQFRGNIAFPQSAFPTRNDSISPLADCSFDSFSSHFVKQACWALHSTTDNTHPFSALS